VGQDIALNVTPGPAATNTPSRPRTGLTAGSRRVNHNTNDKKKKKKNECINVCRRKNYVGTSGRSAHARMTEHRDAVRRGDVKNALTKHMMDTHTEETTPAFTMTILTNHRSNLERLIMKSLLIERQIFGLSVNLRSEWGQNRGVVRITASRI
jgi:hypothetical protein